MKRKQLWSLMCAMFVAAQQGQAEEARLLRFPATNGNDIVFSYAGDLYKVSARGGEAKRLTSHVGYEMFPRFSPDGKTIAFTGQYDGNTEVYTIPADGGEPLRVTYTATNQRDDVGDRMGPNNIVTAWTADGEKIVYRNRISSGFNGKLYTVAKEGGLSEVIPLPEGGFCSFSPDGKRLAYNRVMREFRTWKYYQGGMADDVWIYDAGKKTVENITNNRAQDIFPMWVGNEIYFISDRDRTMNLFVYDTKTKTTSKVTDFTEYDIKFPSTNGKLIVFENAGYIYRFDPATKKAEKVSVTLSSDHVYARNEIKDGGRYMRSASLSPDGKRVVVTARGEVFNLPVEKGVTKNIVRTPGAHERSATWSPDGKHIAYISDATGETELYMQPAEGGQAVQLTKNNDTYIRDFEWSPDSKSIVYTDRKNRINLLNVETKQVTEVLRDPKKEPYDVTFSPDSKWLAYTRMADNEYDIIYLYRIADKKEIQVTDRWYDSGSPTFSTDGKYLVFSSMRDFNPTYGSKEWNHVYGYSNGVYLALLTQDTPSPFLTKDDGSKAEPKKVEIKVEEGKKKETDEKKKPEGVTVKVDEDGLSERIVKLPLPQGYHGSFYSDGQKVYYSRNNSTYVYDLNKQKEETVAEGARMWVEPGGKKAGFFKNRQVFVKDIPSGRIDLKDPVNFSDMKITIDYAKEWSQIYDEAWRAFRDGFYLENMHGVDWKAMKQKYAVLLPYVKNRQDLTYLIGEMIGELNCGHAYVNTGEMDRPKRIKTGLLGAEISRDKSGFFRLEKILPGESWSPSLRSPLTEPGIKAQVGDFIVAIDGVPTNTVNDLFALLVGKADVPTELSLNSKAQLNGARKVVIRPLEEEHSLYHYQWVKNNIAKVDKASGGKIGYIYIPDMGVEGLNEFAKYFYPQLDKEGLIIDDRANGGGNVSPMILERLAREPYRMTMRRGSTHNGTVPNAVQVGPKVCLINKYSASDGDLFPWGFRALKLGKLIGTRTWGGIVGITASLPFIDGTDVRVPFFTSYDMNGNWMVENEGVEPDILIDNDPVKEWNGEDEQLNRAIEEVMKELKNRKPLPKTPAPRVWNK
ncbi:MULTISPECIES: S41 family peptidase [Tannerella]|uniref:Tricorn protease homolog n=1 Tax=Tannerella forsythia TaxID=28112 RepID=A0A3P1Z630_TANFO|nr:MULTISPECIES: S41 family peptidase [Tannerella]MDO4703292.1 PDZ domain-containing protein [Tannerella sp.]RRD76653.1 protease [Tannerella forsythia]